MPVQSSSFWQFSLSLYGMPQVPEACLTLQDGHGADVNTVLGALWAAAQGRSLSDTDVHSLVDSVAVWRAEVVVPLRLVRRRLKGAWPRFDAESVGRMRDRLKAVELESERLQQETLAAVLLGGPLGTPAPTGPSLLRANVEAYARVLGDVFPDDPVTILVGAADRLCTQIGLPS